MKKIVFILTFILVSCNSKEKSSVKQQGNANKSPITTTNSKPIFTKIPDSISHLVFSNDIEENIETTENLFNFDYFYNGAGVGIEDFNNDGLLDVFFCGNQVPNKIFLNLGNLKFKDITQSSNINFDKNWSNGVTFVDINNDGYKDIYISQGGPKNRVERKNLLLINNQDLTFTNKAEEYGLADVGISSQSAFFDFDNDGDLDCVVMNENEIYGIDPINFNNILNKNPELKYYNTSHLYKNENGKFIDITKEAGIEKPIFGLGLCVSDINNDGWLDIYFTSDYYLPDALYINQKNGKFKESIKEFTKQISYYGMGIDIADINSDSKQDIFTLDMSSSDHIRAKTLMASMNTKRFDYLVNIADYHYQYMYNSLQLNLGNNQYSNVAQMTQTANTDWSWSVLMSDYDNDEDNDIYISNGYRKYALDNDLQSKVFEAKQKYQGQIPMNIKKDLYNSMPSEKLPNVLYENKGLLSFKNESSNWGLNDFSFSNGVAQGDLDNDGDLDLIVNNMDENAFFYKNMSIENKTGNYLKVKTIGNNSDPFCKIKIKYSGKTQYKEQKRVRGYMSAQENITHFGLGTNNMVDTLTITWLNGKTQSIYNVKANTTIVADIKHAERNEQPFTKPSSILLESEAKLIGLDYKHIENEYDDFYTEILLPFKQSTFGPYLSKGDLNADGLEDIFIGGSSNQPSYIYFQTRNGYQKSIQKVFKNDAIYEDMESVIFDIDNDNDLDIFVVSGGNEFNNNSSLYQDRIYLNDGKGRFEKLNDNSLVSFAQNGKSVTVIDFDNDGDKDILVGNRSVPHKYPQHSPSILYENTNGKLKDITLEIAPELRDFGIVNSIITTDFNNDGWQDFIAVGEWTGIGIFKNNNGIFTLQKKDPLKEKGWWFSVQETDINNDGLKDYLVGNVGLNLKFKASKKKPFRIYSNDFDNNGTNDIVLSKEYNGIYVPVRGRECSSQQMPFIKTKFKSYSSFANASLEDIYGEELKNSYEKEVNNFKSVLLINKGNDHFSIEPLPIQAQAFPILSNQFIDLNNDGYEDCILAGNLYNTEVETPRLDAVSGLILLNNQKNGYSPITNEQAGLYLNTDSKDILITNYKNNPLLICTNNNSELKTFNFTSN